MQVTTSIQASQGGIEVYCVEPNLGTFAQLVHTRDAFFTADVPLQHQW